MTLHPTLFGRGISSWGVEECTGFEGEKEKIWSWHLTAFLGSSYFNGMRKVSNMAFTHAFSEGGSLFERWRILVPIASSYTQRGKREGGDRGILVLFWGEEV